MSAGVIVVSSMLIVLPFTFWVDWSIWAQPSGRLPATVAVLFAGLMVTVSTTAVPIIGSGATSSATTSGSAVLVGSAGASVGGTGVGVGSLPQAMRAMASTLKNTNKNVRFIF